jgi:hypothetical protein
VGFWRTIGPLKCTLGRSRSLDLSQVALLNAVFGLIIRELIKLRRNFLSGPDIVTFLIRSKDCCHAAQTEEQLAEAAR